ncbi:hypothetical protein OAB51_03230 [Gammaproteobacteria bacterium]|nr:hypothetical protein [Gammaproteobacteria bacterium]MDB9815647.1 hypothetical protein [Gammaproteobacteria bacterium]MDB9860216.1 hypothetical protein [Gammaproteobacteria bacterium]
MNVFSKQSQCIHTSFTYSANDKVVCAECGDLVTMVFDDEEKIPTYFEFLHEEEDGSFAAFHRSFDEQMDLCLSADEVH